MTDWEQLKDKANQFFSNIWNRNSSHRLPTRRTTDDPLPIYTNGFFGNSIIRGLTDPEPSTVNICICILLGLCVTVLFTLFPYLFVIISWLLGVVLAMWLFNKITGQGQAQDHIRTGAATPKMQPTIQQREPKIRVITNGTKYASNGTVINLNKSQDNGTKERLDRKLNNGKEKQSMSTANHSRSSTVDEDEVSDLHATENTGSLSPSEWSAVTSPGFSTRIVRAAEHDPPLREIRTPAGRSYSLSPFQNSPNRGLRIGEKPSTNFLSKHTTPPSPARFSSPQSANRSVSMGINRLNREENVGRLFLKIAPLGEKPSVAMPTASENVENPTVINSGSPGLGGTRSPTISNKFSRVWPGTSTVKSTLEPKPSPCLTTPTTTLADNLNRKRMRVSSDDKPDSTPATATSTSEDSSSNKRLRFLNSAGGGGDAHGLSNPSLSTVPLTNYHSTGTGMSSESILEQMNQTEKRFLPDDDSRNSVRPAIKRQKSNSTGNVSTSRTLSTPTTSPAFIRKRKVLATPPRAPFTITEEEEHHVKEKTPRLCGCADCYKEAAGIPLDKPETEIKPAPVPVVEKTKPVPEKVFDSESAKANTTASGDKKSEDVTDRQVHPAEDDSGTEPKVEPVFPFTVFDKEKHLADKNRRETRLRRLLLLSESTHSQPSTSLTSIANATPTMASQPIAPVMTVTTPPTTSVSFTTPSTTQPTVLSTSSTTLTPPQPTSTFQFGVNKPVMPSSTPNTATSSRAQAQLVATPTSAPAFGFSPTTAGVSASETSVFPRLQTQTANSTPQTANTTPQTANSTQGPIQFGTGAASASFPLTTSVGAAVSTPNTGTQTPTFGISVPPTTTSATPAVTSGLPGATKCETPGTQNTTPPIGLFGFPTTSASTTSPPSGTNLPKTQPVTTSPPSFGFSPVTPVTAAPTVSQQTPAQAAKPAVFNFGAAGTSLVPQPAPAAATPIQIPVFRNGGTTPASTSSFLTASATPSTLFPSPAATAATTASPFAFGMTTSNPSATGMSSTSNLSSATTLFPNTTAVLQPSSQVPPATTTSQPFTFNATTTSSLQGGFNTTQNSGIFPSLQAQPTTTTNTAPFQFGAPSQTNTFASTTTTQSAFPAPSTTSTPFAFPSSTTTPAAFPASSTAFAFGSPFGSTATTTFPATQTTTSAPAFGFSSPTTFGTARPNTSTFPTFTTQASNTPAFTFNATSPMAVTTASSVFGSGTQQTGFGTTSTAPSFGAFGSTPTTSAFSAPAFASPAPAFGTTAPTFGSPSTTSGFTGFGSPTQTTNAGFAFGSPAPTTNTGFTGFGSPASTTNSGFTGFGSPTPTTNTGFGAFGSPAPTTNTGFTGFGSPIPTTSTNTFGFGSSGTFGTASPSTTGFNFGSPAAATTAFGAPTQPASSAPFQFTGTTNVPQQSPGFGGMGQQQPQMFTLGGSATSPTTRRPHVRGRRYR